ncbi:MAG: HAMP domain-containing histidine kinase [Oligoflexia bacterium]|nr:HAMP domain-containing histidine kinase [Oligoflexia bacterium]MBF0364171.1 HAMP domain-containing histidine kinase [Oligoflexia bacterium]
MGSIFSAKTFLSNKCKQDSPLTLTPNPIDPISFFILGIFLILWSYLLFEITFLDILLVIVVDFIAVTIWGVFENRIFLVFFPDYKAIFSLESIEEIKKKNFAKKMDLVAALLAFPTKRAFSLLIVLLLKSLPSAYIIIFLWPKLPGEGVAIVIIKLVTMMISTHAFYWAVTYWALAEKIYENVKLLHQKVNLKEVMIAFPSELSTRQNDLLSVENTTLVIMSVSLLVQMLFLIFKAKVSSAGDPHTYILLLSLGHLVMIGRIFYLGRRCFFGGLYEIFSKLQDQEGRFEEILPLHPAHTIRKFQLIYNNLICEVETRNREIERWIASELDNAGLKNLGELSGIVAHDLSGPLHTLSFCVEEMKGRDQKRTTLSDMQDYIQHMDVNLQQALALVSAFKAHLKNPEEGSGKSCNLYEAYCYTVRLLKSQYAFRKGDEILFSFDEAAKTLCLKISRTSMVHILYNLMKNSVENLVANGIESPRVLVARGGSEGCSDSSVCVIIKDNGTGLSCDRFEKLTGKMSLPENNSRQGLGLRLTKVLIERNGGTLAVISSSQDCVGTTIKMTLRFANHSMHSGSV